MKPQSKISPNLESDPRNYTKLDEKVKENTKWNRRRRKKVPVGMEGSELEGEKQSSVPSSKFFLFALGQNF